LLSQQLFAAFGHYISIIGDSIIGEENVFFSHGASCHVLQWNILFQQQLGMLLTTRKDDSYSSTAAGFS